MLKWIENKSLRLWIPPVSGFLFYGSWAAWINFPHGLEKAVIAGLTQGSYSFSITLILAVLVEWLFVRLSGVVFKSLWVFLAAAILLLLTSTGVNLLTGTPEILLTILPGLGVSLSYTIIYIVALNKLASSGR